MSAFSCLIEFTGLHDPSVHIRDTAQSDAMSLKAEHFPGWAVVYAIVMMSMENLFRPEAASEFIDCPESVRMAGRRFMGDQNIGLQPCKPGIVIRKDGTSMLPFSAIQDFQVLRNMPSSKLVFLPHALNILVEVLKSRLAAVFWKPYFTSKYAPEPCDLK